MGFLFPSIPLQALQLWQAVHNPRPVNRGSDLTPSVGTFLGSIISSIRHLIRLWMIMELYTCADAVVHRGSTAVSIVQ